MHLIVNGEEIDDSLVREEAKKLRPAYYERMGGGDPIALEMQLREWSKENVIERVLLRQAAPEGDIPKLFESVFAEVPKPTQKEVAAFYKKYREELNVPETVHLWQILEPVDDEHPEPEARARIERIEADLRSGVFFDSFSQELGWVARGQIPEPLEQEIFALEIRVPSRILRSKAGFHIFRIVERRAEGIPSLAEAQVHLEQTILEARQRAALEQFVDNLRAKASISTK